MTKAAYPTRNCSLCCFSNVLYRMLTENERVIVENLNDFYQGRTVVVVAHRLSTVKNADQIIVLGHGKILETGNHTSLIEKKGAYYHLVKNQLELGN